MFCSFANPFSQHLLKRSEINEEFIISFHVGYTRGHLHSLLVCQPLKAHGLLHSRSMDIWFLRVASVQSPKAPNLQMLSDADEEWFVICKGRILKNIPSIILMEIDGNRLTTRSHAQYIWAIDLWYNFCIDCATALWHFSFRVCKGNCRAFHEKRIQFTARFVLQTAFDFAEELVAVSLVCGHRERT